MTSLFLGFFISKKYINIESAIRPTLSTEFGLSLVEAFLEIAPVPGTVRQLSPLEGFIPYVGLTMFHYIYACSCYKAVLLISSQRPAIPNVMEGTIFLVRSLRPRIFFFFESNLYSAIG
jgi:hypothetical protein